MNTSEMHSAPCKLQRNGIVFDNAHIQHTPLPKPYVVCLRNSFSSSSTGSSCLVQALAELCAGPTRFQAHVSRGAVVTRAGFGFGPKTKKAGGGKASKDCPCGSGKLYSECCQVFHKSAVAHPSTPARLIQARYSALVKRLFKYLRATCHPDNPALRGSSATLDDGQGCTREHHCTYEEDLAVTFLSVELLGLEVLGSSVAPDGASATVDVRVPFKRVVDETGKRVAAPVEQVWLERAELVKDDEGRWLVKDVQQLKAAEGAAT